MTYEKLAKLNAKNKEIDHYENITKELSMLHDVCVCQENHTNKDKMIIKIEFTNKEDIQYFYEYFRNKWLNSQKEFEEME